MGRGRPSESNYPDRSKPAIGVAMFAEASPPSERGHTLRLEYHPKRASQNVINTIPIINTNSATDASTVTPK